MKRMDIISYVVGALALAALFTLSSKPANAETLRYDDKKTGDFFRLFEAPCSVSEVREMMTQEGEKLGLPADTIERVVSDLRDGEARVGGTVYKMCWSPMLDGSYGFLYPDGDDGKLPMFFFKPEAL